MAERQRGGRRSGAPGKTYSNRTDLNVVRQLPVTSAPGQPYGQRAALQRAQAAVPMASGDLTAQPPAPDMNDVMTQAQQFTPPNVIPLTAPTQRPDEPLMTPPAQPPSVNTALLSSVALLNSLGDDASPAVKALRASLGAAQANAATP